MRPRSSSRGRNTSASVPVSYSYCYCSLQLRRGYAWFRPWRWYSGVTKELLRDEWIIMESYHSTVLLCRTSWLNPCSRSSIMQCVDCTLRARYIGISQRHAYRRSLRTRCVVTYGLIIATAEAVASGYQCSTSDRQLCGESGGLFKPIMWTCNEKRSRMIQKSRDMFDLWRQIEIFHIVCTRSEK